MRTPAFWLLPTLHEASTKENPGNIRCAIEHVRFDDNPQYDAISYVWGPPDQESRNIICDGALLTITNSLYGALMRLRNDTKETRLWADAICINQADKGEKLLQILKMVDIYGKSRKVVIWLGEEAPEDEGSLDFATELECASRNHEIPITQGCVWAFPNEHSPGSDDRGGRSSSPCLKGSDLVVSGSFRKLPSQTMQKFDAVERRKQESLATDPRDKIYGLMGIADEANVARLNITPDYSITVEDIYRSFAVEAIRASSNLDVFQTIRSRDLSALSLPSCVPDWSMSQHFVTLRHLELAYPDNAVPAWQSQDYHCTGDSRSFPTLAGDGNILGLEGHLIGLIGEDWERVARARSEAVYHTGEEMIDIYWQTLCAAVMPGGFQICREEFRRYDAVIQTLHSFANPIRSLRLVFLPLAKAVAIVSGLIYHKLFRSNTLEQDIAGFTGQNGAMYGRRMAWSTTDYMCLVPNDAMNGDSIVVLKGGRVPLVIRADNCGAQKQDICKLTRWRIIGEAYIHGAMRGEAFRPQLCTRFWFSWSLQSCQIYNSEAR